MKYKTLGKTGEKVSILGFGAMRLPHFETSEQINKEETDKIISYGIENGINLIDTIHIGTIYSYQPNCQVGK